MLHCCINLEMYSDLTWYISRLRTCRVGGWEGNFQSNPPDAKLLNNQSNHNKTSYHLVHCIYLYFIPPMKNHTFCLCKRRRKSSFFISVTCISISIFTFMPNRTNSSNSSQPGQTVLHSMNQKCNMLAA